MSSLDEFPSNSREKKIERPDREEKKDHKLEKVVTGSAKKRSGLSKIRDEFIKNDARTIKDYIVHDVLIPSLKKATSEIVSNGIDMLLYGEVRNDKKRRMPGSSVSYRSYDSMYDRDRDRRDRDYDRGRGSRYYSDFVFDSYSDANKVLDSMEDCIDRYGVVTIGDFYDLVGETTVHTDYKFGWRSLRSVEIERCRDGYKLDLPRPMAID